MWPRTDTGVYLVLRKVNQELSNFMSHKWPLRDTFLKISSAMMIIVSMSTSGCATTGDDGVWPRIVTNSHASVKQKSVWIPLAAAAFFAATSADHEVSEWAIEHQPMFGSTENASDWSDWLSNGLVASALITSLAQRDDNYHPVVTDLFTLSAAYAFTAGTKQVADRTRPDRTNDLSFPSLHAASAFSAAQITNRNLSALETSRAGMVKVGLFAFASASAWARVEAARHYPSDVLAGAAIGSFFAGVGNAFLEDRENVKVSYVPTMDGGELRIHWLFR